VADLFISMITKLSYGQSLRLLVENAQNRYDQMLDSSKSIQML